MEFTLIYSGLLQGGKRERENKHHLRREFHLQLKRLSDQPPLSDGETGYMFKEKTIAMGSYLFLPLIRKELFLFAELDIILLRAQPPAEISTTGLRRLLTGSGCRAKNKSCLMD